MAHDWWRSGAIYQIYPRSFQDSNDDGIGDLEGVRRRLDYLEWLGVDALWLSPFYPSPMRDFGYDITDYCDVDPTFGSLADFDRLVDEAHQRGLKVIVDFVPNHTSIDHPWFRDSRQSRADPRRDWYIWRDPAPDGGPPNNWLSHFGGSAWAWDERTHQYYYHAYLAEQPDLNWRNPRVRAAMHDVLRFWLRRGVDGFRVDVIWHLMKDAAFRDNPPNPNWRTSEPEIDRLLPIYSADRPEAQDVVAEMRRVIDEFENRVLIGEIYLPLDRLVAYYGENLQGAHLPFNFSLLTAGWSARELAELIERYEAALPRGAWPNWVLSNHDRPRIAARVGAERARLAAMLLLTLRGTPTLYYGDELGIGRVEIAPERIQDPWEKREPSKDVGRDPSRTPMQWDESEFAGVSTREPWLPLTADHTTRNVAMMRRDNASLLALVRRLLHLRRERAALHRGDWRLLAGADENVLAYERAAGGERMLVALNFCPRASELRVPPAARTEILISTQADRDREPVEAIMELRPYEGIVIAFGSESGTQMFRRNGVNRALAC